LAEENDSTENSGEKMQPGKPFLKFIVLGVAIMVIGAGGFAGWSLFVKGNKKETRTPESPPQIKNKEVRVALPLESFIVNLMDKSGLGKRYLKVTMVLEVGGEEQRIMVERHEPQLRDTILLLLSSQLFDEISTVEGKLELKQALFSRINQVLGGGAVHRIYFTEFVVQ
jgi:flagellar FliL protein